MFRAIENIQAQHELFRLLQYPPKESQHHRHTRTVRKLSERQLNYRRKESMDCLEIGASRSLLRLEKLHAEQSMRCPQLLLIVSISLTTGA